MKFSRLLKLVFLHLQHLPMPSRKWRPLFCKIGGVQIENYSKTFIGESVTFDTNYPQDIWVEEGVRITIGCILLTHFKDTKTGSYTRGKIHIKRGAYIGCNTIICKPVTIGENAIVGAGSVVTKDIPANQVWAGNPARYIKDRE